MHISLENLYVDIEAERVNFVLCFVYFLRFSPCLNQALKFSFFSC